jgi:hypothetical protein
VGIVSGEDIGLRVEDTAAVSAQDLQILGTVLDGASLAVSLGVYESASMSVERFAFLGSETVGLQLMDDASLTLRNGRVEGCQVGANVQIPGYDLQLLQELVEYLDNLVDIDAQDLPPPPPLSEWECDDGIDNDGDQLVDCADDSCAGFAGCAV